MDPLKKELFEEFQRLFTDEDSGTEVDITIDEDKPGEEILHAYFTNVGEVGGSMMTEVNFLEPYSGEEIEAMQIFTTLSADIREGLFSDIETRVNELNALCIFGAFGLYREGKQIFHRYVMPVPMKNPPLDVIRTAWNEIFNTLQFLLPYILIISCEKDFVSIEEYLEVAGGAD